MKKYKVNVNGKAYEIEIELMSESETASIKTAAPQAAPAAVPVASGAGEQVTSPMPGTILSVNVKAGDTVKKGQVLMILEAMKMENEIMAGSDGIVASVNVNQGASVESGTLLCTIQ